MAGIGVRLNRIFEKNTLTTNMIGFFYSTLVCDYHQSCFDGILFKILDIRVCTARVVFVYDSLHIYFFFTYSITV